MTGIERSWCDAQTRRRLSASSERITLMKHTATRRTAVIAVASMGALVMTGGVAFAYWKATGSGSGTATAGTASALTVNVTAITGVYPLEKTTIPVTVSNGNLFGVTLGSIKLDGVTPTGTGCAAGDITLDSTAANVSGATYTLTTSNVLTKTGGSTPSATFNVPISVGDLASTCIGAGHSYTLAFTASGQSS
jgi:hypothetical protein